MRRLYVRNVPKDLKEALRKRARKNGRSMRAEVLEILELSVPTKKELRTRRAFCRKLATIRAKPSPRPGPGPGPSTEEMQRDERTR